jgi:hypothetical protein
MSRGRGSQEPGVRVPDPRIDPVGFRYWWAEADEDSRSLYKWPQNLDYLDLSDLDLSGADFTNCSLYSTNLSRSNLSSAKVTREQLVVAETTEAIFPREITREISSIRSQLKEYNPGLTFKRSKQSGERKLDEWKNSNGNLQDPLAPLSIICQKCSSVAPRASEESNGIHEYHCLCGHIETVYTAAYKLISSDGKELIRSIRYQDGVQGVLVNEPTVIGNFTTFHDHDVHLYDYATSLGQLANYAHRLHWNNPNLLTPGGNPAPASADYGSDRILRAITLRPEGASLIDSLAILEEISKLDDADFNLTHLLASTTMADENDPTEVKVEYENVGSQDNPELRITRLEARAEGKKSHVVKRMGDLINVITQRGRIGLDSVYTSDSELVEVKPPTIYDRPLLSRTNPVLQERGGKIQINAIKKTATPGQYNILGGRYDAQYRGGEITLHSASLGYLEKRKLKRFLEGYLPLYIDPVNHTLHIPSLQDLERSGAHRL